jgi:hypothetical protein
MFHDRAGFGSGPNHLHVAYGKVLLYLLSIETPTTGRVDLFR